MLRSSFDPRVASAGTLDLVRRLQQVAACRLAGGVALSGAYLGHRLSGDVDLFCRERDDVRVLAGELRAAVASVGGQSLIVRDAGHLVRAVVRIPEASLEVDLVHEGSEQLAPTVALEGIVVESLTDLRAAKVTCILSRSEPRDLVDLLFLERAGFAVEDDLPLALRKDGGIDPGILAWLLGQFPVAPLPQMLLPLDEATLRAYRDDLRERLKRVAVP